LITSVLVGLSMQGRASSCRCGLGFLAGFFTSDFAISAFGAS